MAEEKLQQGPLVRSQMTSEKEVVSQSAVEVLDDRTGADRFNRHLELHAHGGKIRVEVGGERQQIVALIAQRTDHRPNAGQ